MTPRLPDETLHVYTALIEAGDAARWALGDQLGRDVVHFSHPAELYRAVSVVGENVSTLRSCHWLAHHIPPVLRSRYPLTRSQWRACLRWGVLVDDYEERVERTEEMAVWTIDHNMATVQAIETEVSRRKIMLQMEQKKREDPAWTSPRSATGAYLRACEVLLSANGGDPGLVALARVLALRK